MAFNPAEANRARKKARYMEMKREKVVVWKVVESKPPGVADVFVQSSFNFAIINVESEWSIFLGEGKVEI